MKGLLLLTVFVLAGCATASPSPSLLRAKTVQQKEDGRVYVVVDVAVKDVEKYDQWLAMEKPILERFGGEVIMEISSEDKTRRYLINAFPSQKSIDDFVASDAFQNIYPMNKEAADTKVFRGGLYE